jgi:[ribosomal protein S5]-alanine N-acetyltransferase
MASEPVIFSERLELHHIDSNDLITLFEDPTDPSIYFEKSYVNPHGVLVKESGPLRWRVPQVKANPELNKWFVRFIVLKKTNEIIGSTSFHGAPNEDGMIEIGLGIAENFRNQGFGTEAIEAMWKWVIDQPGVKTLRYTVSATNLPSISIIKKFGFSHMGQQIDEEDGPEEIYEMSASDFRNNFSVVVNRHRG